MLRCERGCEDAVGPEPRVVLEVLTEDSHRTETVRLVSSSLEDSLRQQPVFIMTTRFSAVTRHSDPQTYYAEGTGTSE